MDTGKRDTQELGTRADHGWGMMQSATGRRQKRAHYWRRVRPLFISPVYWESLCGAHATHHKPMPEDACGRCVRCTKAVADATATVVTVAGDGK